jgi:hypothetical protein
MLWEAKMLTVKKGTSNLEWENSPVLVCEDRLQGAVDQGKRQTGPG